MTAPSRCESARGRGSERLRTILGMVPAYPYTATWNATGQPAAAVPAGFTADGLPLSAQLIGPPARRGHALSLAAQIEAERPWADHRPPVC